jgi:formylglycine-generating enzyme required for sulfatase activity
LLKVGDLLPLHMVLIPGGTFLMGQTEAEKAELIRQVGEEDYERDYARELPQHSVTVPPFFMGRYPITQAQYGAVMGTNPAADYDQDYQDRFVSPNKPVVGVSWNQAVAFCQRLTQRTGRPYRLPSEAEWEYACRAGTTTPFYFGKTLTTEVANYDGNFTYGSGPKGEYRQETTPVDQFGVANAWGLSDMHGNVWEWCLDHYHDSYAGAPRDGSAWVDAEAEENKPRILRGGSWYFSPWDCRCASRFLNFPDYRLVDYGFRVVSVPPRALGSK